jgi:hypothetical protein
MYWRCNRSRLYQMIGTCEKSIITNTIAKYRYWTCNDHRGAKDCEKRVGGLHYGDMCCYNKG